MPRSDVISDLKQNFWPVANARRREGGMEAGVRQGQLHEPANLQEFCRAAFRSLPSCGAFSVPLDVVLRLIDFLAHGNSPVTAPDAGPARDLG